MADAVVEAVTSKERENKRSCRYTAESLLEMRESLPFVVCDVGKLTTAITEEFLKIPAEAQADPENYSCTTKDLMLWTSRSRSTLLSNLTDHHRSSHGNSGDVQANKHGFQYQPHVKWAYRRRDKSDRSSQPQPAPSGIDAQKAANFQRFYRAVVSPNHVRVTAGGRIIPNTLGPPQPVLNFLLNQRLVYPVRTPDSVGSFDRSSLDERLDRSVYRSDQSSSDSFLDDPTPWMQGVKLHSAGGYIPNIMPVYPGSAILEPPVNNQNGVESGRKQEGQNTSLSFDGRTLSGKIIELSPPNTFDRTRPFSYNGQTHYPIPTTFPIAPNTSMIPLGIFPGSTNTQAMHPPGAAVPSRMPVVLYPAAQPLRGGPMQHAGVVNTGQPGPPIERATPLSLGLPSTPQLQSFPQVANGPTTLIPISANLPQVLAIRSQIQLLEQQRNRLENQLLNNKHQIDERQITNERDQVQRQIDSLQGILMQLSPLPLAIPESQLLPSQQFPGTGGVWPLQQAVPAGNLGAELRSTNTQESGQRLVSAQEHPLKENIHGPIDIKDNQTTPKVGTASRSRLTAAAATAPPFQPRSQQVAPQVQPKNVQEDQDLHAVAKSILEKFTSAEIKENVDGASFNPVSRAEPLLSGAGIIAGNAFQQVSTPPILIPTPPNNNWIMQDVGLDGSSGDLPPNMQEMNLYLGQISTSGAAPAYLIGYPPHGIDPSRVKSEDMLYTRPLTEEEIRARYLYWGKAPREALKGLPKFDGRNFYPPSPVKQASSIPEAQPVKSNTDVSLNTPGNPTTQSEFTRGISDDSPLSSSGDPFRDTASRETIVKPPKRGIPSEISSANSWGASKFTPHDATLLQPPKATAPKISSPPQGQPSFLQGMLRKSRSAGLPTPLNSELSSATAQGYLPQFEGAAVASLTPSMKSQHGLSPAKKLRSSLLHAALIENRPPSQATIHTPDRVSAAQMLRKIKSQDNSLSSPSRASSSGKMTETGPVIGSEW